MTPEKSTTTARRSALRPKLSTLTLSCALSVLPLNVFLPSLANIAQDFRADYALVSLSLAGYAVVAVALELIMGPLSDRFGRRPIVMVSVATFTIVSIGRAPMPARSRRGRTWLEAQPGWQAL
ncbi:MFS transporter [Mesorhizobium sp.]|uniref:MFS transporter n=1 Tax=Mesorhizobium sp. TaxID=1871066 RepID=UPI000FE95817|nr:MFS transporter [Mesorhizobium sp.]RWP55723.1 MAG: MFS transporter [Mesorhizobium sp.]